MTTEQYQLIPIDEPYDDVERELIGRIESLKREYEQAAKPYIDALVRSRNTKPASRFYIKVKKLSTEARK